MKKLLFFALLLHLNNSLYAQPTSVQPQQSTIPLKAKIIIAGEAAIIIYCLFQLYESDQGKNKLKAANIPLQERVDETQRIIESLNQGAETLRHELNQATTQRDEAFRERDKALTEKNAEKDRADRKQAKIVELMGEDQESAKGKQQLENRLALCNQEIERLQALMKQKETTIKDLFAEISNFKGNQENIVITISNQQDNSLSASQKSSWREQITQGASLSSFFSY
jgi:uncharacterized small protein (DUF1192 family)